MILIIRTAAQASTLLHRFTAPDSEMRAALTTVYGTNTNVIETRTLLYRKILNCFLQHFGDGPARLFRCPGRINLRGMHVDTHGGYLNLMTHQREVVIAARTSRDDLVTVTNTDSSFRDVEFRLSDHLSDPAFRLSWSVYIANGSVSNAVASSRGAWDNYILGSVLRSGHEFPDESFNGMQAVVGSDLPRGAALSSSAALCIATILAFLASNNRTVAPLQLMQFARDAEWYTGSRCGLSDQAAMVLGGKNQLVNVAIDPTAPDLTTPRRINWPEAASVIVIPSFTDRSISGEQQIDYTRNRFAYSLAIAIARQELKLLGIPEKRFRQITQLPHLSPDALIDIGGLRFLYNLLLNVPVSASVVELRTRYKLPEFDPAYAQYFGTLPEASRPTTVQLRGPLLYGIAESERARVFDQALEAGNYPRCGALMSTGHNGDRRVDGQGRPYVCDVSDTAIQKLSDYGAPIESCPGSYGASSEALDMLVDTAVAAGSWGASLTGAGIAGSVVALCDSRIVDQVKEALNARLLSADYSMRSGKTLRRTPEEVRAAIQINCAPASAGEFIVNT